MDDRDRFLRQILVSGVGETGQRAIARASALVVGCGALGSVVASFLTRAGVGGVTLVDPDHVESPNLHRQILFDQGDADGRRPKVDAARARLDSIHPRVSVRARICRFDRDNAEELVSDADVVVDGTDNFDTRYLINEVCVRQGKPWVYGGVVGASGMSMTVVPERSPCLRCVFPEPPDPGVGRTPERDGVFGPVVGVIGSFEAAEALKLLVGAEPSAGLLQVDLWTGFAQRLELGARRPDCETCGAR